MSVWVCKVCGFNYDESKGAPVDGIPAGTRWKKIPEEKIFSQCGAPKSSFEIKKNKSRGDAFYLSALNP